MRWKSALNHTAHVAAEILWEHRYAVFLMAAPGITLGSEFFGGVGRFLQNEACAGAALTFSDVLLSRRSQPSWLHLEFFQKARFSHGCALEIPQRKDFLMAAPGITLGSELFEGLGELFFPDVVQAQHRRCACTMLKRPIIPPFLRGRLSSRLRHEQPPVSKFFGGFRSLFFKKGS